MSRLLLLAALVSACHAQPLPEARTVTAAAGPIEVQTVADGLDRPWGMAFLPDGRLLVTERPGRLRIVGMDGTVSGALAGTPDVFANGQGGLMDVALAPDFATSRLVYVTFARPGPGGTAATALGRARLGDGRLDGFETLWTQTPFVDGSKHFGTRLAFAPDGHVFVTTGERFQFDPAQDPSNTLGTVVRLNADGSVPTDNPFVGQAGHMPEIWSYGHRNVESAAIDPATGELWVAEMGPRGGDELNLVRRGANYGWPTVSWGENYDGTDIPDPPTRPEFAAPATYWTPVISPSGMTFYTEALVPAWTGSAFLGSLSRRGLVRVSVRDGAVVDEEILPLGARIRDVETGPDGALYALTDERDGKLLRLAPQPAE